jgi:tetratricopeptide (TPR) repeat protein
MTISSHFKLPVILLLISEILLLLFFPPSLIFSSNVTAGGDTPSHFIAAMAMRDNLLSFFSPVAWIPGNFAGYPIFLNYFPFPFFAAALLSLLIPLQIAFKLVTLLAVIPLPAAVYFSLRRMGCNGNVPALGSVFSISFLFMNENSMWGGNILSTLAGEFPYGISFVLFVIFLGKMYADAPKGKSLISNSVIQALIGLSSGYPLLQAGAGTSYFLLRGGCMRYVLSLHAIAFGLISFWLVPLIWHLPWDTSYPQNWFFRKWSELFPPVLLPALAGAFLGLIPHLRNMPRKLRDIRTFLKADSAFCPEFYLWWQFGIALVCFSLAAAFGLADVRFLPFAQITIAMLGAIGWGNLISRYRYPNLCTIGFAIAILALSLTGASKVDAWIRWNYSGMGGSKPLGGSFSQVNDYLRGTENSPRVVYEHSPIHDGAGTVRAFELLPGFSGRSTLEGLYMQSSVSSPFIYYIQSELTQSPSALFEYDYFSRPDVARVVKHLNLFNVSQVVAVSDDICNALDQSSDYELQMVFPPYKVYRLRKTEESYVVPLRFQPFRIPERNWKSVQFEWFRKSSTEVPLIVASPNSPGSFSQKLPELNTSLEDIPRIPILAPNEPEPVVKAVLDANRIKVTTNKPGHPLWIKVSYHPDWRITAGEGELCLASPAFMLLVPKTSKVTLEFDTTQGPYLLGKILSMITFGICLGMFAVGGFLWRSYQPAPPHSRNSLSLLFPANAGIIFCSAAMAVLILVALFSRDHRDPLLLYDLASKASQEADNIDMQITSGLAGPNMAEKKESLLLRAAVLSDECIGKYPESSVYDFCIFFKARALLEQKRWHEVRDLLEDFLESHPDSRVLPDARFMLAEAGLNLGEEGKAKELLWGSLLYWPASNAGSRAGLRLAEILGPEAVLRAGRESFDSEKYLEAYCIFKALTFHSNDEIKSESSLALAYCCYRLNRWEEASSLFLQWLSTHFESPESEDAQFALRQCQTISNLNKAPQTPSDVAHFSGPQSLYQYLTGKK